jgi:hypothetical protein
MRLRSGSVPSSGKRPDQWRRIRAAKRRKEYSPRRKPWVKSGQNGIAPKGRKTRTRSADTNRRVNHLFRPVGARSYSARPTACAVGYILDAAPRLAKTRMNLEACGAENTLTPKVVPPGLQ